MKLAFIDTEKVQWPVLVLCAVLGVSRAGSTRGSAETLEGELIDHEFYASHVDAVASIGDGMKVAMGRKSCLK